VPSFIRKHEQFLLVLFLCCVIHAFVFLRSIPVFYLPDLVLIVYLIYKFKDLNQEVSPIFFVGLALLLGFYLLSPEPPQIEFSNNFIVTLKPFAYICILALYSRNPPQIDLAKWVRMFLVLYPLILLWNLAIVWYQENATLTQLMTRRPYFIFENNFEITFYLNCFTIVFFILGERRLRDFVLLVAVIILAGSRSGLLSFAAICVFYFFAVSWRQKIAGLVLGLLAVAYIGKGRNISAPVNTIDRVQSLQAILSHYDFSFLQILKEPFGYGIYSKVPGYVCAKIPDFAEWFTGNSNNCDPLMLQAFYTRAMYQFGIYITLLVPILFFLVVKKEIGWRLAIITLTPMACVATSVGGFSNGLAFWGVLISIYVYLQYHYPQTFQIQVQTPHAVAR
jgi:hypothetical protein